MLEAEHLTAPGLPSVVRVLGYEVFVLMKIKRIAVYSTLHFGPGCSARRSNVENNR